MPRLFWESVTVFIKENLLFFPPESMKPRNGIGSEARHIRLFTDSARNKSQDLLENSAKLERSLRSVATGGCIVFLQTMMGQ